jgi:hypothetical protein
MSVKRGSPGVGTLAGLVPVALVGFALVLASCTSASTETQQSQGPKVLTYNPGLAHYEVQTKGTLAVQGGCVVLHALLGGRTGTWGLLWPNGVTVSESAQGVWTVLTSDGKVAGKLGAKTTLGGGPLGHADAQKLAIGGIPSSCTSRSYFAISGVLVGNR